MSVSQHLIPATIEELTRLREQYTAAPLWAGGTDLMPLLRRDVIQPQQIIHLHKLREELSGVKQQDDGIIIGALTVMSTLVSDRTLQTQYPLLAAAAGGIGARQIQEMATLAGNIANASPSADSTPPLLVYEAELLLQSTAGERWLPLSEFYLDYKVMAMQPGEWIRAIRLPLSPAGKDFYSKTGARQAQAIAKLSLAALINPGRNGVFRVAAGAMSPYPKRLTAIEEYVAQQRRRGEKTVDAEIRDRLAEDLQPIDDLRSTAVYRRQVAGNILCETMREAGIELD